MLRILIADPDPASRRALALLLTRKMGPLDIMEATDIETLIQLLADSAPDLLLLDWKLPGSPAPETCRLLRKAHPNLKIALLSTNPDDACAARAVLAEFVYKGAPPDHLLAALKSLFPLHSNG